MITNQDLLAYGREQEEKRRGDRVVYLLHRLRVIRDAIENYQKIHAQLQVELDQLQEARRNASQLAIFSDRDGEG